MYKEVEINKIPSKGVFYDKNVYFRIRPYSHYEMKTLDGMITNNSFTQQLGKLEFATLAIDTNMDPFDVCYNDLYYLFYCMYGLTYSEIAVDHNGKELLIPIEPEDFLFSNPSFSTKEDFHYEKRNLNFYLPSIYNMMKAHKNIINVFYENEVDLNDVSMRERLALVPYLQREKISDNALDFVNIHMRSFSDEDIKDMRKFVNSKENLVMGQRALIIDQGEQKEILLQLNQLL